MTVLRRLILPPSLLLLLAATGCRINDHRSGADKGVSIGTPFGSLNVRTNEKHAVEETGLTPYPGAVPLQKEDGDNSAADVNMSFGSFHLGVHAAELQTADAQQKVLDFYRHDLGRYGAVIACHGHEPIGEPTRTPAGLTCGNEKVQGVDSAEVQLRAGSKLHQHIVGVKDRDGGTRIALVALDLPGGGGDHDSDQQE